MTSLSSELSISSDSQPERIRFVDDAESEEEAKYYFQNRLTQLLFSGWRKGPTVESLSWGLHVTACNDSLYPGQVFHSIFVYTTNRNQGHYKTWIQENPTAVMFTVPDCQIESYFQKFKISYVLAHKPPFYEYQIIEKEYSNKIARRSGVHLMNHIDEGLWILSKIGASSLAMRAFVIHPILQDNSALSSVFKGMNDQTHSVSPTKPDHHENPQLSSSNSCINDETVAQMMMKIDIKVIILAMEYRWIANSYLAKHESRSQHEILLSPLLDVTHMLIADKVQNRKDFDIYHKKSHPNAERLSQYFAEWLERLEISESQYLGLINEYNKLMYGENGDSSS